MANCELTQTYLKELLDYSPDTGFFRWKVALTNSIKIGMVAGGNHRKGYGVIVINKKAYLSHRLAWLYMTGSFPIDCLDHINRNRYDNRFINLRLATRALNTQNRAIGKNNKTGFLGVSYRKDSGKYRAEIDLNKKTIVLGSFLTPQEASNAYLKAKRQLHIFCTD